MKAVLALSLALLCLLPTHARAAQVDITAPSAILMEKSTGEVLFEQDSHAVYEPASVTKIMTLLLVMEAIDAGQLTWDDVITASPYAGEGKQLPGGGMPRIKSGWRRGSSSPSARWSKRWPWPPPTTARWPWPRPYPAVRAPLSSA